MNLKKISISVMAVLALSATFTATASAGNAVTDVASWTYLNGGVPTSAPDDELVKCNKTPATPNFVFRGAIGLLEVEITATGVECIETKLSNDVVGGVNMATAVAKFKFTGVTVDKPAGCKTPATNTTNALVADLQMDQTVTTKSYLGFAPAEGANLTTIKLEGCAAEGIYPVKGVFYTEATNQTAAYSLIQEFASSMTTHAMSSLTFSANPATLTGEIAVQLAGANGGSHWGAEGK